MTQQVINNTTYEKKVIAIVCGDLHLSHTPPVARSGEKSWYKAMERALSQIDRVAEEYQVPVLCAGDIFDTWKSPPELINFAIENLPENMYAIPGQHDIPFHNIFDIRKSAYWTLVASKKIFNLHSLHPTFINSDLMVYGYPWGEELAPCKSEGDINRIALVHSYIWTPGNSYPNAPTEAKINKANFRKKIKGYSAVIFGDNHQGFRTKVNGITIFNCGTLMRRKSNEIDYRPQIGLLTRDGNVTRYYLGIKRDRITGKLPEQPTNQDQRDIKTFLEKLGTLEHDGFDFVDTLKQAIQSEEVPERAKKFILESIEGVS